MNQKDEFVRQARKTKRRDDARRIVASSYNSRRRRSASFSKNPTNTGHQVPKSSTRFFPHDARCRAVEPILRSHRHNWESGGEGLPGDGGASDHIHLHARGLFGSIPSAFHPRAALETRGVRIKGEERRAKERRRDENELELAGYLLGGPR